MKINKWTVGLAALGLVTLAPALVAQTATQQNTPLLTALSATTISGYVDTSAVWNPGTGNANPAPYAFNAGKQDGFNIDAIDIKLSKAIETGKWSAGYVAELNYGPDATGIDGGSAPIRQAYVDLGVPIGNGLELKMGRWDNLLGYETSDSMNNPNWSRSYGYSFEPTEHTGLLASYQFASWLGLQVGAADTLTTTVVNGKAITPPQVESKKTIVSLLTLTAPDSWGFLKGSALYGGFDHGQGVYGADTTEFYVGATINTPVTGLTLGGSWDSVQSVVTGSAVAGPAAGAPIDGGYLQAIAGYASYKLTDKATINGRFEYADGSALSSAEVAANSTAFNTVPYGTLDKVIAVTGTLQYDLWANVISRLEVRWDHNAGGTGPAFGGTVGGLPTKNNEIMIAANVIYKF
jgi:hypothetical protein